MTGLKTMMSAQDEATAESLAQALVEGTPPPASPPDSLLLARWALTLQARLQPQADTSALAAQVARHRPTTASDAHPALAELTRAATASGALAERVRHLQAEALAAQAKFQGAADACLQVGHRVDMAERQVRALESTSGMAEARAGRLQRAVEGALRTCMCDKTREACARCRELAEALEGPATPTPPPPSGPSLVEVLAPVVECARRRRLPGGTRTAEVRWWTDDGPRGTELPAGWVEALCAAYELAVSNAEVRRAEYLWSALWEARAHLVADASSAPARAAFDILSRALHATAGGRTPAGTWDSIEAGRHRVARGRAKDRAGLLHAMRPDEAGWLPRLLEHLLLTDEGPLEEEKPVGDVEVAARDALCRLQAADEGALAVVGRALDELPRLRALESLLQSEKLTQALATFARHHEEGGHVHLVDFTHDAEKVARALWAVWPEVRLVLGLAPPSAPQPVHLCCPRCLQPHLDEGEWASHPHRTHLCLHCKHEWRPFPVHTVGVEHPDSRWRREVLARAREDVLEVELAPGVGPRLLRAEAVEAAVERVRLLCAKEIGPRDGGGRYIQRKWNQRLREELGLPEVTRNTEA